jgi:hypothetical protein
MDDHLPALRTALAALRLRAWRLHLNTPDVQATVPMLRGVWGAALHELDLPLYHRLFSGGKEERPLYLLRPAPAWVRPAPALELILFGPPEPDVEQTVWSAWERALHRGLGPDRVPARLVEVRPLAWDGTPLAPARLQPGFSLYALPWPGGAADSPCQLAFAAPTRILRDKQLIEQPALPDVVIAALRRVQALAGPPGEAVWRARQYWLDLARRQPAAARWQPLDLVRYSGRQHREVELCGVAGELDLPAGPGPFIDLLSAARWLHVGKGTVMGLGRLDVVPGVRRSDFPP